MPRGLKFERELFDGWERLPKVFQLHPGMLRPLFGADFLLNITLLMVFSSAEPGLLSKGMLLVYFGKQRRIGATFPKMFTVGQGWEISFWGHIFCISGHATTQRGAMEITNQTQQPQPQPRPPQHLTAVTLVSAKRTINWVILQTRRTVASKRRKKNSEHCSFCGWTMFTFLHLHLCYNKSDRRNSESTLRQRETKRRQRES